MRSGGRGKERAAGNDFALRNPEQRRYNRVAWLDID